MTNKAKRVMATALTGFSLMVTAPMAALAAADIQVTIDAFTDQFAARDFSSLLKPKTRFLGFVGTDYQRLDIVFVSVTHDASVLRDYTVSGYSLVRGVQTPFTGTIRIRRIDRLDPMHFGVDDAMKPEVKLEGVLYADVELTQTDGGRFVGEMALNWFIDRQGRLRYDDIEREADGYRNNQYRTMWFADSAAKGQVANWGEYRIPDSGDLDIGAAEFSPDPKYRSQGW